MLSHLRLPLLARAAGRAQKDAHGYSPWALPLLGSNQDSPDPESGVLPVTPRGSFMFSYGAEGDRTPDLLIANEALSQLSYSPTKDGKTIAQPPAGQPKEQALAEPFTETCGG
jgi:hypothetical protein